MVNEHPSDHRWGLESHGSGPSISVIEPGEKRTNRGPTVPFGFARVLPHETPKIVDMPLLWEGD